MPFIKDNILTQAGDLVIVYLIIQLPICLTTDLSPI